MGKRGKKTDIEKYVDNMSRFKYKCKCGHTIYMNEKHPKTLCHWCKTMNYLYKEDEFKEKLKNALKKNKYMI